MKNKINIGIAGNPNAGKTTIFNNFTGTNQHVGNYPGVTIEKKEGKCTYQGADINIIDLPGTYSLTSYSPEEIVTRDFILQEKPDIIIDVIDASNLERNLYLTTQIIELETPLILAFNMSDIAKKRGIEFNLKELSHLLGIPIIPTIGSKNIGMNNLLEKALNITKNKPISLNTNLQYGKEIEQAISIIKEAIITYNKDVADKYSPRWLAIKLLEDDGQIKELITSQEIKHLVQKNIQKITKIMGDTPEIIIADRRYGFISGACQETIKTSVESRHIMSDKIDVILTHPVLGMPIFLFFMYMTFTFTFTLGSTPMIWIENFFGWLQTSIGGLWPLESTSIIKSLVIDGIIAGVGGVVIFLPNIILLFLGIAVLEDSGYMARAAFVMDKLMHKIGLHGKSFIPMLIGFGCSVPAIMATRTLNSKRDRITTMLVIPLMSCGAKFPIYTLIIPAFFPENMHSKMLFGMYLIGILLAIIIIKILRSTILKGESIPFVMELPPYRIPTLKGLLIHARERSWIYLKNAGTIILFISIILWFLTSFPKKDNIENKYQDPLKQAQFIQSEQLINSFAGRIGRFIEPALKPMGFDWKIGTALIGAFAAKEVFVVQMGIVYSVGDTGQFSKSLRKKLQDNYTPLVGFCIMLFSLIATPCMATIAVTKRESSWGWALLQLAGLTFVAYLVTMLVYQLGTLLKIGL